MMGPVIKDGQERAFALRTSVFDKQVNWRQLYRKVECVGVEDVEGKPAYEVELTPAGGSIETAYFDKETGLQVKVALKLSLPMGTIPVQILLSDYREVDGVLFSHKARRVSAGQQMLIVTESIEHNVDMPADRFKLPDDIQAIVDKRLEKRKAATP